MNMRERIMLVIKAAQARPHTDTEIVDAVLDVLMDPTEEMVDAGRWPAEDDGPLACWRAMIQAARKEK